MGGGGEPQASRGLHADAPTVGGGGTEVGRWAGGGWGGGGCVGALLDAAVLGELQHLGGDVGGWGSPEGGGREDVQTSSQGEFGRGGAMGGNDTPGGFSLSLCV
jgi:hypothetical protein